MTTAPLTTRLAAVHRALDREGCAIIATGLEQCPSEADAFAVTALP
jgi:hypothetical protein